MHIVTSWQVIKIQWKETKQKQKKNTTKPKYGDKACGRTAAIDKNYINYQEEGRHPHPIPQPDL